MSSKVWEHASAIVDTRTTANLRWSDVPTSCLGGVGIAFDLKTIKLVFNCEYLVTRPVVRYTKPNHRRLYLLDGNQRAQSTPATRLSTSLLVSRSKYSQE